MPKAREGEAEETANYLCGTRVKVRIYRTVEQKASLSKAFGCARWFWNNSLKATNELYKETVKG